MKVLLLTMLMLTQLSYAVSFKLEKSQKKVALKATTTKTLAELKKTDDKSKKVENKKKVEAQKKTTVQTKFAPYDHKSGEVLGLKLINPDEHCEDDKESKVPVSPLKIPFANDTRQLNLTRFSDGQAAYFFDIISPLFEKAFGTEAAEDFNAFSDAPEKQPEEGEEKEEQIKVEGKISESDLENGFEAYNWRPKDMTADDYIFSYTKGDNENALTFREFVFFEIDFISKRVEDDECQHCFNKIREKIKEFFDYADCADKGEVTAEMLFKAVISLFQTANLQSPFPATTSMTNDFILKSMEINSATIDLKDFTYAVLSGFMERLFDPEGGALVEEVKDDMKSREEAALKGNGPKRRRRH